MSSSKRLSPTAAVSLAVLAIVGGVFWAKALIVDYDYTSEAVPSEQSSEVQAYANSVFESFNGTPTERDASGRLQAWGLNGAMDECMRSLGFPNWDWSSHHNGAPRTNALDVSLFFAPPLAHSYSNAMRDIVHTLAAEERARAVEPSEDEDVAINQCADTTTGSQMSDDELDEFSRPAIVADLRNEWWSMLASWDADYGKVRSYNRCFDEGANARSLVVKSTNGDRWKGKLSHLLPRAADIPPTAAGPDAGNAVWQGFIAVETSLEELDWACRSAVYERHLDDIEEAVSDFADEHAAEIEQARSEWAEYVERAAELPKP